MAAHPALPRRRRYKSRKIRRLVSLTLASFMGRKNERFDVTCRGADPQEVCDFVVQFPIIGRFGRDW
jgi:hypothetical protein